MFKKRFWTMRNKQLLVIYPILYQIMLRKLKKLSRLRKLSKLRKLRKLSKLRYSRKSSKWCDIRRRHCRHLSQSPRIKMKNISAWHTSLTFWHIKRRTDSLNSLVTITTRSYTVMWRTRRSHSISGTGGWSKNLTIRFLEGRYHEGPKPLGL